MRAKTYGYFDVGEHAWMLLDKIRVKNFGAAILNTVKQGDVVVDVGAGSGILSLYAAKAGASKVYAIEQGSISKLAKRNIEVNGYSDVIEVIKDNARNVVFDKLPNVIVSEMIGNFGFDEDILSLLRVVMSKCTKDVKIIPHSFDVIAAPLYDEGLEAEFDYLSTIEGFDFSPLLEKLKNRPVHHRIHSSEVMSESSIIKSFDIKTDDIPSELSCEFTFQESVNVNAVGIWVKMYLDDKIFISTGPDLKQTHWYNIKFPLPKTLFCSSKTIMQVKLYPFLLGRTNWKWDVLYNKSIYQGNSWNSIIGNKTEMLLSLGLKRRKPILNKKSPNFQMLCDALEVKPDNFDLNILTENLYAKNNDFYDSKADAYTHLTALLDSIHILK